MRWPVIVLCFAIGLAGCSEHGLPHGYRYVILNGSQAVIASPTGEVVVDADVKRYRISGAKVIGRRDVDPLAGKPPHRLEPVEGQYGTFVLDTVTGSVTFPTDRTS